VLEQKQQALDSRQAYSRLIDANEVQSTHRILTAEKIKECG
jgi:hypothetical protein